MSDWNLQLVNIRELDAQPENTRPRLTAAGCAMLPPSQLSVLYLRKMVVEIAKDRRCTL